ncbi:MAG: N-acetylmuramoyl-L-alanine amidase [Sumerlaeia bacterium]
MNLLQSFSRFGAVSAIALALGLSANSADAQTKIYIDPGHGGSDPGAVNGTYGTEEADRVLYTSLETRDWLNADTADGAGGGSWTVRLSRTTDVSVGLSARSTDSNNWGSARFLSIHQNANAGTPATGTETFSYSSTGTGATLRNNVQNEGIAAWGLTNRGNKVANFSVLRLTSAPAALTEMGFINNTSVDWTYLSSNTQCDKWAKHMMFAFQNHYGISDYTPGATAVEVIVDNDTSAFIKSSNWWASSSTSGYYGSNYRVRSTGSVSDSAIWKGTIPSDGSYKVYARWTSGSNRASSAPYIVYHTGGSSTVNVNQQANNGTWVLLGTYNLYQGSTANRVALSCWTSSGTYVIADAVRFVKQ